jgi:hypothetical protein
MLVLVTSKQEKNFPDMTTVCINNDQGGTEFLPVGTYLVKVTDTWHDYEIGSRAKGVLVNEKDIEVSRKVGTTKFHPKEKYYPERVYFSTDDAKPYKATRQ